MYFNKLIESILESEQTFDVKCVKGPYWLPDEIENATQHFAYDVLLNGKKMIIGEEPDDDFRYVYEADQETYDLYVKNKATLIPLIRQVINQFKQKQRAKEAGASEKEADIIVKL